MQEEIKKIISLYIPEIKKLIKCPKCGEWNRHDAEKCDFCGASLISEEE